jgi:NarL family two-component system response regulator YdfI
MMRGLQAGAYGYLLKHSRRETILHAIRTAARGETILPPDILQRMLSYARPAAPPASVFPSADTPALHLTEREQEVLRLAARGERNKEIARRLGITTRTVAAHLSSIYGKLGVDSRVSAVTAALERGLLPRKHDERLPDERG